MFNVQDHVRVVTRDKKLRKEGVIVKMTTTGAHVYDPTCVWPFVDSITNAEWFPFHSKEMRMLPAAKTSKKRKV